MQGAPLNTNSWQRLPGSEGDVRVSVVRMHGADPVHDSALGDLLYDAIQDEAHAHGTSFDGSKFSKILDAVGSNKIQAYFVFVSWENCRPQMAGGAIQLPSIYSKWNGNNFDHYPAVYCEDTTVDAELSKEFRDRTIGPDAPNGIGLGTYFTLERIKRSVLSADGQDLPYGMITKGRIAEQAHDNPRMIGIYKKLGTFLDLENSIMIFPEENTEIKRHARMPILTEGLGSMDASSSYLLQRNVFVTSWTGNNGERIIASFTDAISTFTGDTVVRVQFTTNGKLPESEELKSAVASLLLAGQNEIHTRKWIKKGNEIQPRLRIHALNEPSLTNALQSLGAQPRMLGQNTMHPNATDLTNLPDRILGFKLPTATPFITVRSGESTLLKPFRQRRAITDNNSGVAGAAARFG